MKNLPEYRYGLEETMDYLLWLDLFLEHYEEKLEDPEGFEKTREKVCSELKEASKALLKRQEISVGKEYDAVTSGVSIVKIAASYGISGFCFFCLLMAVAIEIDEHYEDVYKKLRNDDKDFGYPTFSFALSLYSLIADENEMLASVTGIDLLERLGLFEVIKNSENESTLSSYFCINSEVGRLIRGTYYLSGSLSQICYEPKEISKVLASKEEFERFKKFIEANDDTKGTLIHVVGRKGSGKKMLVTYASKDKNGVLFVDYQKLVLLDSKAAKKALKSILVRVKVLNEFLCFFDVPLKEEETGGLFILLDACFESVNRIFITSEYLKNKDVFVDKYEYFPVVMPKLRTLERESIWFFALLGVPISEDVDAGDLSRQYNLSPGAIIKVVKLAIRNAAYNGRKVICLSDIKKAVVDANSSALDELATAITPCFDWEDLKIDERQLNTLKLACNRIKLNSVVDEKWGFETKVHYGKGISILLYGPPGTGKTMTAQVLANSMGMGLYRVDLSTITDKYIGETEKNIGKIFDAAASGNNILFFDEADSLFSKRTEISNSNDKYANNQVAYLLQRIEDYEGITILATNNFQNFDKAFIRRITFTVNLDKPDVNTRKELFRSILPNEAEKTEDLDLDFFAEKFDLTGSVIKSVLYNAAFLAAQDGEPIGNKQITRALRNELKKQGAMVGKEMFGKYSMYCD